MSEATNAAMEEKINRLIDAAREGQGNAKTLFCEEASPFSIKKYIPCGEKATKFVLSERGEKVYPMCAGCADHNIRHRDAKDVGEVSA